MAMTHAEAKAWFKQLADETMASYEEDDAMDLIANKNAAGEWIPRSDAEIEARKHSYEQKYAVSGASGGDRDRGGYSTSYEDDPDRVWKRGETPKPADPGQKAEEGQEFKPYEAPSRDDLGLSHPSGDMKTRIIQMYNWFYGRDPSTDEVQGWWNRLRTSAGARRGWEKTLHEGIVADTEEANREKLEALYEKYYGRMPHAWEYHDNLRNEQGLAGVEWALAQNPTQAYKDANPAQVFIAGQDYRPPTAAKAGSPASWSGDAPTGTLADIVGDPSPDPPPPPPISTAVAQTPPRARAQPVPAAPKVPYSARAAIPPYTVSPGTAASTTSGWVDPYAPQRGAVAGMPPVDSYQNTMGGLVAPPPGGGFEFDDQGAFDPVSWQNYGGMYGRAGQAYAFGPQGTGYNPAPWANVDRRLRGQFGRRGLAGTGQFAGDDIDRSDESAEDRRARRAYEFGRRDRLAGQYNTDLANRDSASQMDRWIQSYNQWIQQGVDPFARPMGGRRALAGTDRARNTGGA